MQPSKINYCRDGWKWNQTRCIKRNHNIFPLELFCLRRNIYLCFSFLSICSHWCLVETKKTIRSFIFFSFQLFLCNLIIFCGIRCFHFAVLKPLIVTLKLLSPILPPEMLFPERLMFMQLARGHCTWGIKTDLAYSQLKWGRVKRSTPCHL